MRLKDYAEKDGKRDMKFQKNALRKNDIDLYMIGASGGVYEDIWQLILQGAVGTRGQTFYRGVEIATKPVHQHCSAEGL